MKSRTPIRSWAAMMILVLCNSLSFAQAPKAVIRIEGYSPQEIDELGWISPRSTGLPVIGIGQVIYLIGRDSLNAAVTGYAWTLVSKPTGSSAVLDSNSTQQVTFKPDIVGKFSVQLVITTAGGASAPRPVTITSSKFVGVGGMDGLPSDPSQGQCSLCHSTNFNQWTQTGHSSMLARGIDGELSPFYNEACIQCHTTGYDTEPTAVNDGFDDVQAEVGWTFPTALQAGNWDSLKAKYPQLAHRANVQCESCHGPGSLHKGDKTSIAMSLDEAVCGYCHEEAPYNRQNTQWKESLHASTARESQANNPSCAKCHSGWAFIRRVDVIPNDTRPTLGFPQISCAVCHDQHRATLPNQVRSLDDVTLGDSVTVVSYGGMGKVCMQCHISRRDAVDYTDNPANLSINFGPHYSNQADMLDGSNAIEYGIPIASSGHKSAVADACVTCHMQATPALGQPGRDRVGEHTFEMHWDGDTPDDPADDIEHVAVCQSCHGPLNSFDDIMAKADFDEDGSIEGTRDEIAGLIEKLDSLLPPRTSTTVIRQTFDWTLPGLTPAEVTRRKAYTKAWFNWRFVEEDGSGGVHNATYAITLLRRSIASLTTGDVGAAEIISINDAPNDQGKQVRVAWSKFPGDGTSVDPIASYSLWRRVEESAGSSAIPAQSKDAMIVQGLSSNAGKRFVTAQEGSWDFVAWVPAEGHEMYSIIAPTIFDSTAAGIRWSVFFVSGQSRGGQVYETAPDSGYSVDNLAPAPPSSVSASIQASAVKLQWDDPVDADFKYFAIYRSTTRGFDPKGATPIATFINTEYTDSEVVIGTAYYYRVSAFDFAGNESLYSPEISTTITRVDERGRGVPTTYVMDQNYPNPFNPETTIKYQLPATGHVRLTIYNALGEEARQLINRIQPAAYHAVVWDGRDNAGNLLPSGVYLYRLESGEFTAIKKMVLMK